jgi:hypothetical protein
LPGSQKVFTQELTKRGYVYGRGAMGMRRLLGIALRPEVAVYGDLRDRPDEVELDRSSDAWSA